MLGIVWYGWLLIVVAFCAGALVGARNRNKTIAAGRLAQSAVETTVDTAKKRLG